MSLIDIVMSRGRQGTLFDQLAYRKMVGGGGGTLLGTDTEPYQYRHSPSLGDYKTERDEIVGVSVGFNQLVQNGDFESTNGWTATYGTVSASNNEAEYTVTTVGSSNANRLDSTSVNKSNFVSGHKYLYSFYVKTPYAQQASFTAYPGFPSLYSKPTTANAWSHIEGIAQANATGEGSLRIGIHSVASTAVGDKSYVKELNVYDLTAMLGTTIADYIYTLEQGTAGAGVAFFRKYFGADYYPFDSGSIRSVEGLVSHTMRDGNDNIIGEYPLDSTVTLRGHFVLDNGELKAEGDIYPPSGQIARKWNELNLGELNWQKSSSGNKFYAALTTFPKYAFGNQVGMVCAKYVNQGSRRDDGNYYGDDKCLTYYYRANHTTVVAELYIHDEAYSNATAFKESVNGVYLAYEKEEVTTEQAQPYAKNQKVSPSGTEEYVTTSVVPVGHNTEYYG